MSAPATKFFLVETTVSFVLFVACAAFLGYDPLLGLPAGAVGAVFVWAGLFCFKKGQEDRKKKKASVQKGPNNGPKRNPCSIYSGKEAVAHLFLDIFKRRLNAKADDPSEFEPLDSPAGGKNSRYELKVLVGDRWQSRIVSIGELGEFGTGKSRCYHVIYDSQLVVKIPAKTSSSAFQYVDSIRRDLTIVERLAPRECLVPGVSVILDKLLSQEDAAKIENESKALEWLLSADEYQPYFKIGDSFVYFMHLSRYFFLGRVLDEIHDNAGRFYEEAFRDPDMVLTPYQFEDRYGDDKLGYTLHDLYSRFESGAKKILAQNRTRSAASVHPFKFRQWFFHFLAGKKTESGREQLPENALSSLNRFFSELEKNNPETVESYRSIVRKTVEERAISVNSDKIANISSNILDLLGWLYEKRISIRDLKPDNLLLIGPPDDYPEFLKYPGEFQIGLIDVETAAHCVAEDGEPIPQPLLGGTPLFATPANFLPNSVMEKLYGVIPPILHLQDWYAAIGIIFRATTGEDLFKETSVVLVESARTLQNAMERNAMLIETVPEICETFWSRARRELALKLESHKENLVKAKIPIPERTVPVLQKLSRMAADSSDKSLKELATDRRLFANKNVQCIICKSTAEDITKLEGIWTTTKSANASSESRAYATDIFRRLLHCKMQSEKFKSFQSALDNLPAKITADLLLESLFEIAFVLMHQQIRGVAAEKEDKAETLPNVTESGFPK